MAHTRLYALAAVPIAHWDTRLWRRG